MKGVEDLENINSWGWGQSELGRQVLKVLLGEGTREDNLGCF